LLVFPRRAAPRTRRERVCADRFKTATSAILKCVNIGSYIYLL
jgi:hypothetical protein